MDRRQPAGTVVIGIDPGTAITGYGLVRENPDGSLDMMDFGAILTPADAPMSERLLLLHQKLKEVIFLHHPESGAVEKLFFQRNVRTAMSVGQARGVAILTLAEEHIPLAEYTPMEVKQAVAGFGGADKHQVGQMVRALLGLAKVPEPDDAADALAVAVCHIHSARMRALMDE